MTTAAQWFQGSRPRTLPAAVAPVLVGSGAAAAAGAFRPGYALLALVVSLALQVAVNYANDYSDGIRGTDEVRVGPLRLVGQKVAAPAAVKRAALLAFGVAAIAGLALALLTSLWLVVVGAAAIAAGWFYTGGGKPYGYLGLGEVFVFVFFGLVAVIGTTYVQTGSVTGVSVLGGVTMGALACALLVVNNLRDIPGDTDSGKQTLAVRLGDPRTRALYLGLVLVAAVVPVVLIPLAPWAVVALIALPLSIAPVRTVQGGALGRELIPVLAGTAKLQIVYAALLGLGLALG